MSTKPNDLVLLETFGTEVQARILAERLDDAGIFAVIEAPSASALGFLNVAVPFAGAQVLVRAADIDRAQAVASQFKRADGLLDDESGTDTDSAGPS